MGLAHILLENDSSDSLARQRVFCDGLNPLIKYYDVEFITRYRVMKSIFFQLEERLLTFLNRATIRSHPIATSTQLAAALQFMTTESFQTGLHHHMGCHIPLSPDISVL